MYHGSNLNSLIEKTSHFDKDERYVSKYYLLHLSQYVSCLICFAMHDLYFLLDGH
jgi:hypothetical protein